MSIVDNNLLRLMSDKMAYLSQRQAVLAQNIANSDTPGYKARDLAPFEFKDALKQAADSGMSATNPGHIIPASMAGVNAKTRLMKSVETLPSGNSVELEEQAMQVSQTAIDYQWTAATYKKVSGWVKLALGRKGE